MQILRVSAFLIQIQVGQLVVKAQLLILLMEEKRGQFKTHLRIVMPLFLTSGNDLAQKFSSASGSIEHVVFGVKL